MDRNSSGGVLVGVYVLIYVRFTSNTTSKVTCLVLLSQEDLIWASLFVSTFFKAEKREREKGKKKVGAINCILLQNVPL